MAIRKIQNMTIYAELDEPILLPDTVLAINDDLSVEYVPVSWYPNTVDTSVAGDYIFVGTVSGYPKKVLLSVITDGLRKPEGRYTDSRHSRYWWFPIL